MGLVGIMKLNTVRSFSRIFASCFLSLSVTPVANGSLFQRATHPQIGLVKLYGTINAAKVEELQIALGEMKNRPRMRAIVLQINSGGGGVAPSYELYELLKNYSIPIVSFISDAGASGAYWSAAGTDWVIATPVSQVGGIGVISTFTDASEGYAKLGIKYKEIYSGDFKTSGTDSRPMTTEEEQYLQQLSEDTFQVFKHNIQESRNFTDEEINALARGQVFIGYRAKELRLIDELGTLEVAVRAAKRLGGLDENQKIEFSRPAIQSY